MSMRQERRRKARQYVPKPPIHRRFGFTIVMLLVLVGGGLLIFFLRSEGQKPVEAPEGVEVYENLAADHVQPGQAVEYEVEPPVGGPHATSPYWLNCGFYSEPVPTESAVHSLEHGAVWITHQPDLPEDQINVLRGHAGIGHVIVSPWPNLEDPVVASAWGRQLKLDSANDPELEQFIEAFRGAHSPTAPEPGATCAGGVGEPQ